MVKIIVILICLGLERFINLGGWFKPIWFEKYLGWFRSVINKLNPWLAVILIVAPVLIIFGLLDFIFGRRFFDLFNLVLAVIVLFFTIDARDLKKLYSSYFSNLKKNDFAAASQAASEFLEEAAPTKYSELVRSVTLHSFAITFERLFTVLFWYMVLGIYGVAVYSMIAMLQRVALKVETNWSELAKLASSIKNILDWFPARLLGLTYMLAGHFSTGFNYCKQHCLTLENRKFITEISMAALDADQDLTKITERENHAALDMVNHALIIWILAMVLFTIGRLF